MKTNFFTLVIACIMGLTLLSILGTRAFAHSPPVIDHLYVS
ncbi:MAG: hypothetical protein ACOXZ5_07165 [Syntrophomonadaceae bacterium]|jgi:hypothetical protein